MGSLLETKIGHDYERLVSDPLFDLKCQFSEGTASGVALAEGNPDEEKIGAFGVGE